MRVSTPEVSRPASNTDLAFLPVTHLARLVESRQVTSTELTELYLARLKEFDPVLMCVVNLTEDLAREQAARADEEIAAGNYRDRSTGSRGEPRTCWRSRARRPPGGLPPTATG